MTALAEVFEICAIEMNQKARIEDEWFLDSDATTHFTRNRDLLTDNRIILILNVTTAGYDALPVEGHDKAIISKNKVVENILYVSSMQENLLLVGKFADEEMLILFGSRKCWIFDKKDPYNILLTSKREQKNSLYRLTISP